MQRTFFKTTGLAMLGLLACCAWAAPAIADKTQANAQAWNELQTKAMLNGGVQAQAQYEGDITTVLLTTKRSYKTDVEKKKALQAASLVQRDVARFCAGNCWPETMPAPKLLPTGQLAFELSFSGLGRQLFQEELPALVQGIPTARPVQNKADDLPQGVVRTRAVIKPRSLILRN